MEEILFIVVRFVVFFVGLVIVAATLISAIRSFVLPRSAPDRLSRATFLTIRFFFILRLRKVSTYLERDRIMALYAPLSLVSLPAVWLTGVLLGYMCMFWAVQDIAV